MIKCTKQSETVYSDSCVLYTPTNVEKIMKHPNKRG